MPINHAGCNLTPCELHAAPKVPIGQPWSTALTSPSYALWANEHESNRMPYAASYKNVLQKIHCLCLQVIIPNQDASRIPNGRRPIQAMPIRARTQRHDKAHIRYTNSLELWNISSTHTVGNSCQGSVMGAHVIPFVRDSSNHCVICNMCEWSPHNYHSSLIIRKAVWRKSSNRHA